MLFFGGGCVEDDMCLFVFFLKPILKCCVLFFLTFYSFSSFYFYIIYILFWILDTEVFWKLPSIAPFLKSSSNEQEKERKNEIRNTT